MGHPASDTVRRMGLTWAGRIALGASAALTVGLMGAPGALATTPPGAAQVTEDGPAGTITVMGRNLYLGADTSAALALLPDCCGRHAVHVGPGGCD